MPITDVPATEFIERTTVADETKNQVKSCSKKGRAVRLGFTLTDTGFDGLVINPSSNSYILTSSLRYSPELDVDTQYSIISDANMLFKDTKPLEGKKLEILNKTYSRLLSKTPRKLF